MKNYSITVNSTVYEVTVEEINAETTAVVNNNSQPLINNNAEIKKEIKNKELSGKAIKAQVPGKITQILVKEGQSIKNGDTIVMLEAMKMETNILAKTAGEIEKIFIKNGDQVGAGQLIATLK